MGVDRNNIVKGRFQHCLDDLILDYDSDLSIFAFVEATKLLEWYFFEHLRMERTCNQYTCLTVDLENYHVAAQLAALTDIGVQVIVTDEERDHWCLETILWSSGEAYTKRVCSPGA